jgi:dihydrofolate synthase/folylpolyglutamate synthase
MTHPILSPVATPDLTSSLSQWLNYMQQIHVSAIDMGLSRVLPVAEHLGVVQSAKDDAYVFTVAGTNGKGSTTAVIAEICQQAGYKTALYQSPHLIDFNERVRINGQAVGDQVLVAAFYAVEQARLACDLTLSFFEMTTLAAMQIFAEADCDVWVLEVGLGGRLDVVNIIDPDMAVITNIGIDHVDWLGDTKEKIGAEKAGILRQDGTLIFGDSEMPQSVQDKITALNVTCYQAGQDFSHFAATESVDTINSGNSIESGDDNVWQYSNAAVTMQLPKPPLSISNTANAISAILASPLSITQEHMAAALHTVRLAGRFDRRQIADRQWLFDVAHNLEGISFVMPQVTRAWQEHLQAHPTAQLHLVFSMLVDKPIQEVVSYLAQSSLPIQQWHVAAIEQPRAAPVERLSEILSAQVPEGEVTTYLDLAEASTGVIAATTPADFIFVCGSFHTIAEVLIALKVESIP